MNTIKDIEIKEGKDLTFALKFHLNYGSRTKIVTTFNHFENTEQRIQVLSKLSDWETTFFGWDWRVDEEISKELGYSISEPHLLSDEDAICIFYLFSHLANK